MSCWTANFGLLSTKRLHQAMIYNSLLLCTIFTPWLILQFFRTNAYTRFFSDQKLTPVFLSTKHLYRFFSTKSLLRFFFFDKMPIPLFSNKRLYLFFRPNANIVFFDQMPIPVFFYQTPISVVACLQLET